MIRRLICAALALSVAAGLSSCQPLRREGPRTVLPPRFCFNAEQVQTYSTPEEGVVYIRAHRRQVYRARAVGQCRTLDYSQLMSIRPAIGDTTGRLCEGEFAELFVQGGDRRGERCRVEIGARLTDDEVAALPTETRPQGPPARRCWGPLQRFCA